MNTLTLELPADVSPEEARIELAIALYRVARVTQGQAGKIAGHTRETFLRVLAKRGEPSANITVEDLEEELETWRKIRPREGPGSPIS